MSDFLSNIYNWLIVSAPDDILTFGFAIGALFIIVNLQERFDQILDDEIPEQLRIFRLSQLTEPSKFLFGKLIYLFLIIALYTFLVLALTQIEDTSLLGLDRLNLNSPDIAALTIAMILAGLIPNVRHINKLEHFFRKHAQAFAGIPSDHAMIYQKISANTIQTEITDKSIGINLTKPQIETLQSLIGENSYQEFRKCKLILNKLSGSDGAELEFGEVSVRVRDLFETVLDGIRIKINSTATEIKNIISLENSEGSNITTSIKKDIRSWFKAISYMLGCAIVADSKIKDNRINDVLREFGFDAVEVVHSELIEQLYRSIFFSFFALFLVNLFFYIASTFGFEGDALPSGVINALVLSTQYYIATLVCVVMFLKSREYLLKRSKWYSEEPNVRISSFVIAVLLAIIVLIIVPYLDLIARRIEGGYEVWSFHTEPRKYLSETAILFAYPMSFLIIILVYIEKERKAKRSAKYRRELYNTRVTMTRTITIVSVFLLVGFVLALESLSTVFPDQKFIDHKNHLVFLFTQSLTTSLTFCLTFYNQSIKRSGKF